MNNFVYVVILTVICEIYGQYANEYPYQKYALSSGGSQLDSLMDSDGARYLKNNLRDHGGKLKANTDTGHFYNVENTRNGHDLNQVKHGGTSDNLTHIQGEDFETDKSHKRKHIKSGFQNSYHKDENGSKSSFYEDSDDQGGKVVYDKRHGIRGDQQDVQFQEGTRNGVNRDKYDDRRVGFNNRDLRDMTQFYVEDQGKQNGYYDNHKTGQDDRFEVLRRPSSDYYPRQQQNYNDDDYNRYSPSNHWGYNSRLPTPPPLQQSNPSHDYYSRRKITIYEDPRDDYVDTRNDRLRDGNSWQSRVEESRRYDYRPNNGGGGGGGSPLRLRYRGLK